MKRVGPDTLRNLPIVGALLGMAAIAGLGLAYWSNVSSREHYLQSRNFRLLEDVADQAQTILLDAERIIGQSIRDTPAAPNSAVAQKGLNSPLDKDTAKRWAREVGRNLRPTLRRRQGDDDEPTVDRRIAPIELWRGETMIQPSAEPSPSSVSEITQQFKQYRTSVQGAGSDIWLEWTPQDNRLPTFRYQLPAAALFCRGVQSSTGIAPSARWRWRRPMAASCSRS